MGQTGIGDLREVEAQLFQAAQHLQMGHALIRNRVADQLQAFQAVPAIEVRQPADGLQPSLGQAGVLQTKRLEPLHVLQLGYQFVVHLVPAKLQGMKRFAIGQPNQTGWRECIAFQDQGAEVGDILQGTEAPFGDRGVAEDQGLQGGQVLEASQVFVGKLAVEQR